MKIAFFEIEDWEIACLQKTLSEHELFFHKEPLMKDTKHNDDSIEILSPFIYSTLNAETLSKFTSLRYITTRSTGFDHVDLSYCKKNNILVSNVPEYGTHTVAEHTFALILAITRMLIPSIERARTGDFSLNGLRGSDLYGKTLGVIGVGNIGKAVITIAKGFGLKILAYTKHPDKDYENLQGIDFTSLDILLHSSDIITLHLPYNKETHHFINRNNISIFKQGSILINTARGSLIETEAILLGLEKGYLKSAGIDVLEEECHIKEERQLLTEQFLRECDIKTQLLNHILLTKENVIITPHNAFNSDEALQRIIDVTVDNIRNFILQTPKNLVA